MPAVIILHKADPLAFGRASDDHAGAGVHLIGAVQCIEDFGNIVPVDFLHMPAKRYPFISDRFCWQYIGGRAGLLDSVIVQDGGKISQLIFRALAWLLPRSPRH